MIVENEIGKDFNSLAERILYSYIATYPIFNPINNEISEESQNEMYDFIRDTLLYIYRNPGFLGVEIKADNYYEEWQLNNTNPALIKSMEKIENKFADFVETLIKIGALGDIEDNRLVIPKEKWAIANSTIQKFEAIGICCEKLNTSTCFIVPKYPNIFDAWKMYSENDDAASPKITRVIAFIHGRYLGKIYRAADFFGALVENEEVLHTLEDYLETNNFGYINTELSCKTRYAFTKWMKEYPKGEYAYMNIFYNWRKKNQIKFELRLPKFMNLINHYDEMNQALQEFIFDRLKNCDHCGYCTQTDKSGKRKCLSMDLTCNNRTLNKCPLYPYLMWNDIREDDLRDIQRLFEFSEKINAADLYKNA